MRLNKTSLSTGTQIEYRSSEKENQLHPSPILKLLKHNVFHKIYSYNLNRFFKKTFQLVRHFFFAKQSFVRLPRCNGASLWSRGGVELTKMQVITTA